jgi:hypothetical protein
MGNFFSRLNGLFGFFVPAYEQFQLENRPLQEALEPTVLPESMIDLEGSAGLNSSTSTDDTQTEGGPASLSFGFPQADSLVNGGAPASGPMFTIGGITYSSYSGQRAFEGWNGVIFSGRTDDAPPQAPPDNPLGPEPGEVDT